MLLSHDMLEVASRPGPRSPTLRIATATMPATYGSSSFNSRTYSKKSGKRRQSPESEKASEENSSISVSTTRKRRKVSVETTVNSPTESKPIREVSTDIEDSQIEKPAVRVTYGTPKKSNSRLGSPPSLIVGSPSSSRLPKLTRDLSGIFESITPTLSPLASPTKLAKRMLARSKTESSIDVQSTSDSFGRRTPSLPNMPPSPCRTPTKTSLASPSRDSQASMPPPVPLPTTSTTRTYAGKSRSFLVSVPASSLSSNSLLSLQGAEEEEDEFSRESYTALRYRWGVDNSEDDPYPEPSSPAKSDISTPNASPSRRNNKGKRKADAAVRAPPLAPGMMNPLKSISELRSKGESRRFLDEVGYLFEGMHKTGGIGLRRASALEITIKLCDPEFSRKAKAADFFGRTWDVFLEAGAGKGEDKILDILLALFAALVAKDSHSVTDLAHRSAQSSPPLSSATASSKPLSNSLSKPKSSSKESHQEDHPGTVVDALFSLLASEARTGADPLALVNPESTLSDTQLKKVGITKKDKTTLLTVHNIIATKSSLFSSGTLISMSLLITQTLQALSPSLLPAKNLPTLLTSLRACLTPSPTPSALVNTSGSLSSSLHLTWRETTSQVPYENAHNHLRLLDTYLLSQWDTSNSYTSNSQDETADESWIEANETVLQNARDEWLIDELISLGVCAEIRMQEAGGENESQATAAARRCMELLLRVLVSLTHADQQWGRKVVESEAALGFIMRVVSTSGDRLHNEKAEVKHEDVKQEEEQKNLLSRKDIVKEKVTKGEEDMAMEIDVQDENIERRRDAERAHALDRLCLALGLLTNLVQGVGAANDSIRDIRLDPSCTLKKRSCLKRCVCPNTVSALEILVQLYKQQLIRSYMPNDHVKREPSTYPPHDVNEPLAEDADASFLRCHLAVLFGLLMRGSRRNQELILTSLPSTSSPTSAGDKGRKASDRQKLNRLTDQARDFVAFYAMISGEGDETEREARIARDVVRSLERLRDSL
ncbi:hypothetical protein BDQ12DRAFT_734486 [Crucibulum laeve]|uniref:Wings apart-like protein C-terminal domain-containing protein n=1 Tax=Crucibulum laeve TaxID=68775 RepID=A0A5C3M7C6_9AGAR|nr:hypothetical protein BDQ12DRAFT_734486 [Crucibulum laeve]